MSSDAEKKQVDVVNQRSRELAQRFRAQRNVPPQVSRQQIREEIPVTWEKDANLLGYINKYMLKGSGAGFVVPPYTAYWERLWGAVPIEDLPKYKDLYNFTPYIKAAIDCTINLGISNGFELEGGDDAVREWLSNWLDEQNILETLRVVATDMLDFGNFYFHEVEPAEDLKKQFYTHELAPVFKALVEQFEQTDLADKAKTEEVVKTILDTYKLKFKTIAQPMRVALTGKTVSPGIFEIIVTLGKSVVLSRLKRALVYMQS